MGGYPLYSYLPQRSERGVQYKRNDSLSFLHIFPGRKNTARRHRKIFFFFTSSITHAICRSFDSILFYRMARRQSKCLRLEAPEIDTRPYECFVCHITSLACEWSVLLPCCCQMVHKLCQSRWEENNSTCGLCRTLLPGRSPNTLGVSDVEVDKARNEIIHNGPDVDTDRIAREVLQMTREEVISRLCALIDSPALEEQLERVRGVIPIFSYYLAERSQVCEDPRDIHVKSYIFVDKLLRQTFFH